MSHLGLTRAVSAGAIERNFGTVPGEQDDHRFACVYQRRWLGISGKADQSPIRLPPACRLHSAGLAVNIGIIAAVLAVGWPAKERASA